MTAPDTTSFDKLLERVPAAFFRQTAAGVFREIRGGFERLTGVPVSAVMGDPSAMLRIIHERDIEGFKQRASFERRVDGNWSLRVWHAQTGELKTFQEIRQPVPGAEGEARECTVLWVDRTDWAQLEKRIELGAWKEVLSVITLGIAHDFNNALTGLNGMSDLLLAQTDAKHPFREPLQVIHQSVKRANELVRRLHELHQSSPGKPDYSDLGRIVVEVLDSLHKVTPSHLKVKRLLHPKQLPIFADSWRVRLVILQLFQNAIEASVDAATLEIQTSQEMDRPSNPAAFGALAAGPWVRVRIRGAGAGLPLDLAAFPGLFTLKTSARGAGLGLWIVRRFCEETGAALFVDSSEPAGSGVELWLKEADFTEAPALATATKRLLISAPEKSLAGELASLCKANGYSAIASPSLEATRRILALNPEEFDAVILAGESKQWLPIFNWLKREKLPVRLILLTSSENAPEADLVMAHSDPETFLRRLKGVF